MEIINFIINNILTQAGITLALIALLGLILQKKSFGNCLSGAFKTLLGFMVLSAGSAIIVGSLTYFGKIFTEGFGLRGIIPSIEAINGQAMNELGLGSQIAFTFLAIFIVNIILARITKWKYIFLTGQALLWMATMCTAFGYFAGFRGFTLVIIGGIIGGIFAVAMPAIAQPIIRKITGSNDIALGHFCTIGYLVEAELGTIGGTEEGIAVAAHEVKYTDPKIAKQFVEATNVDALAVAVGTNHGQYKSKTDINFDLLKEIHETVDIPLVIHGGTGVKEEDIHKCTNYGVRKFNVGTELLVGWTKKAMEKFATTKENASLRNNIVPCNEVVYEIVKHKIGIFLNK